MLHDGVAAWHILSYVSLNKRMHPGGSESVAKKES